MLLEGKLLHVFFCSLFFDAVYYFHLEQRVQRAARRHDARRVQVVLLERRRLPRAGRQQLRGEVRLELLDGARKLRALGDAEREQLALRDHLALLELRELLVVAQAARLGDRQQMVKSPKLINSMMGASKGPSKK